MTRPCHTILASAGGNKTHFLDLEGRVPEYHAHLLRGGAPYVGILPGARRLTVRESAIIQSFPPEASFVKAIGEALVRQIANADAPSEPRPRQHVLFENARTQYAR